MWDVGYWGVIVCADLRPSVGRYSRESEAPTALGLREQLLRWILTMPVPSVCCFPEYLEYLEYRYDVNPGGLGMCRRRESSPFKYVGTIVSYGRDD